MKWTPEQIRDFRKVEALWRQAVCRCTDQQCSECILLDNLLAALDELEQLRKFILLQGH